MYGKVGDGQTTYTSLPYLSYPNSNALSLNDNEPDNNSYWLYIEEVDDEDEQQNSDEDEDT